MWTDGRYYIQIEKELYPGWKMKKMERLKVVQKKVTKMKKAKIVKKMKRFEDREKYDKTNQTFIFSLE